MSHTTNRLVVLAGLALAACAPRSAPPATAPDLEVPALAQQVEIRRTTYGVPQINADNLTAAGFALAWVMLEDHGNGTVRGMEAARGRLSLTEGKGRVDADAAALLRHRIAQQAWPTLSRDVRDVYDGFAAGMNHYIRVHTATLHGWATADFTGVDVLAREVGAPSTGMINGFVRRLEAAGDRPPLLAVDDSGRWVRLGAASVGGGTAPSGEAEGNDPIDDVGSNAWALAPSRTTSGHAILLRNPHLNWNAGYYEAHVRVPGVLDFYGDFRVGGPFTTVGGFNPHLGFATTNNASRSHEFYAFRNDPAVPDAILLDGVSERLIADTVVVAWQDSTGRGNETRTLMRTRFGPVIHRDRDFTYIVRMAADGDAREGEQWLAMMRARSLGEWQAAMRIGARTTSNFTYADRDGNIMLVWMTGAPILPHPSGGDSVAILAHGPGQVWQRRAAFDQFPTVLNPPGGYVRNENDSPHFTNARAIMRHDFPFHVEPPRLRFRSQHGIALLDNDRKFSLEDVVTTKHSMRMMLADRVKPDLLAALAGAGLSGELAAARDLLAAWDNTVAATSRGGTLFEVWWNRYRTQMEPREPHAVAWSESDPIHSPAGLADAAAAVEAFRWAVPETTRRFGAWNVAWGEVNRVRRGSVDAPVGGCSGALGCFRVLTLNNAPDGKRVAGGGDGWVIAVEFGPAPRAYSILAYGQSPDPRSPWHANQAAMFANNEMKAVVWTEADIARATVQRYRPGQRRGR